MEQKLHTLLEYLSSPTIRVTRQEPLVEQKLHTLLEYLGSPTILSGIWAAQSLVFCVVLY